MLRKWRLQRIFQLMSKQMLTIKLDPRHATLQEVRKSLELNNSDIDDDFGVNCIDPSQNLYVVMLEKRAAEKLISHKDVAGPFSNPKIEPFGPPV